jgi:hypothetical protein
MGSEKKMQHPGGLVSNAKDLRIIRRFDDYLVRRSGLNRPMRGAGWEYSFGAGRGTVCIAELSHYIDCVRMDASRF